MIQDSGNRTKFDSGAVRDIQEGKGRCDLLPLHYISYWCNDPILESIAIYTDKEDRTDTPPKYLCARDILNMFTKEYMKLKGIHDDPKNYRYNLILEVAKHFEEGAKKYGDRNWEKGIPCDRYIDSAVRHYCKWRAGWDDEPHDRAFIWNIVCCEWTRQQYGWNLERLKKVEHSESPLTIHVKKEDIRNEDILRQIKEQEISDLKAACDVAKRHNACRNEPTDVCCTKSCMDCEYNVEPEDVVKALDQLADYFKKSLENTEAK